MGHLALILGGSDKGAHFTDLAAALSEREEPVYPHLIGETASRLQAALEAVNMPSNSHHSLEAAVQAAYGDVLKHQVPSCVLLSPACASFGLFEDFADRGRTFAALVRRIAS